MRRMLVGIALVVIVAGTASAEPLIPMPPSRGPLIPYSYSPYANGIRVTTAITSVRTLPTPQATGVQTSVSVPDGGTVLLGGINTLRDGRNEFAAPGLGRPPRNVGVGRSVSGTTIMVKARVIALQQDR